MAVVDEYLASLDADQAAAFGHIRDIVLEIVPDAGQATTYNLPAFTYRGRPLLAFRAWKHHLGLYPCSGTAVAAVAEQLDPASTSKGTIRFTVGEPLPDDLLRRLLAARMEEIDARVS